MREDEFLLLCNFNCLERDRIFSCFQPCMFVVLVVVLNYVYIVFCSWRDEVAPLYCTVAAGTYQTGFCLFERTSKSGSVWPRSGL